jgi:hypothetical protein
MFATHPPTPERVKKSQEEINKVLSPRESYVVTTSDFEEAKARLAGRKIYVAPDGEDAKPTLRRRPEPDRTSEAPSNPTSEEPPEDRPTLKRRPY